MTARVQDFDHLPSTIGTIRAAYTCRMENRAVPGDGVWLFQDVRQVTGGLDATLAAYRQPDLPKKDWASAACKDIGFQPHSVYLDTDAGLVAVREPLGACEVPDPTAVAAFDAMTSRTVSTKRLNQVDSDLSTASGCSLEFKDMLREVVPQGSGGHPPNALTGLPPNGAVKVCAYETKADGIGRLDQSVVLDATQRARIDKEIRSLPPEPTTCKGTEHTRFAVLIDDLGGWTVVALDSCGATQDGPILDGSDSLRTMLKDALARK